MRIMKCREFIEVDIGKAISVGHKEGVPQEMLAVCDPPSRVGIGARVDKLDIPSKIFSIKIIDNDFFPMPQGQDELRVSLLSEDSHDIDQDRSPIDRQHGLGEIICKGIRPSSFSATQDDDLHSVLLGATVDRFAL